MGWWMFLTQKMKQKRNFEKIKCSTRTVLDCFEKLNFKLLVFSLKKGNSRVRFKKHRRVFKNLLWLGHPIGLGREPIRIAWKTLTSSLNEQNFRSQLKTWRWLEYHWVFRLYGDWKWHLWKSLWRSVSYRGYKIRVGFTSRMKEPHLLLWILISEPLYFIWNLF